MAIQRQTMIRNAVLRAASLACVFATSAVAARGATASEARAATRFATAVAVDRSGRTWVGTETKGLWCFDPAGGAWTNATTADGLGGDAVHALAVDRKGRVWAGHAGYGVSVSADGKAWRTYGLLTGPLGERVFAIAASPADDSVWVATNRGLSRYDDAAKRWTYFTREQGLPSDEVRTVAIDAKGTVYAGTLADGLSIGSPQDGYRAWRAAPVADPLPAASRGQGLPSRSINAVLIGRDGTIYVGTTWGLARSTDGGQTFTYDRGRDWLARLEGSLDGAPDNFQPDGPGLLAEDYVASLGEDPAARIYVGHRRTACTVLDPANAGNAVTGVGPRYVTAMATAPNRDQPVMATYGDGVRGMPEEPVTTAAPPAAELPVPAAPPTDDELAAMLTRVDALPGSGPGQPTAAYLGSDWATLGDAPGRYGWHGTALPRYGTGGWDNGYNVGATVGPHNKQGAGAVYTYYAQTDTTDPRGLWVLNSGKRMIGEWNDGTWQGQLYPPAFGGPDLWLAVDVPKGVHRVSLYLMNNDPHEGENRHRDHVVELKRRADAPPAPADRPLPQRADEDSAERERRAAARLAEKRAAERLPAIARTRATDFHGPFYAQFALTEGRYWLIVRRDGGYCTKAMGVFFDRLGGPADPHIADVPPPMLHHVDIRPAPPAEADLTAVGRPRAVWAALDAAWERAAADPAAVASLARIEMPYRVLAYRAAAATLGERADESLARWRYKLPLWTSPDRSKLIVDVTAAWERNLDDNPSLVASDFKAAMEEVNKAYHGRARKGGGDPAPVFDPTSVPVTAAMPSLKAGVAGYLAWKVNDAIGSFSGSPTTPDPAAFRNAFGGGSKEPVEQYKHVAHLLQAADGFANRTADDKRRVGLAAALAAGHASADGLRDPWLTRRIVDAFVVPLLPLAEDDPASPVSKQAVARQVLSLYAAADADEQATAVLEEKARAAGLPVD